MTAATRKGRKPTSIRTLWAIAKSPELGLSDDDLHTIVYQETREKSMEQLTQGEINTLARVLQSMKDGVSCDTRRRCTDEDGGPRTVSLQHKIYALCDALDWNDDHRRINGFVEQMFSVDRVEWLTPRQCGKVVETLKTVLEREQQKEGQHETDAR